MIVGGSAMSAAALRIASTACPSATPGAVSKFSVLAGYWPPERRHVDDGYRSLPFPFEELDAPAFEIRLDWRLEDLVGYIGTWSAVWALQQAEGEGPFATFKRELAEAWGPATPIRTVRWPLALRVGRV